MEHEDTEPLIGSASVPDCASGNSSALASKLAAKEKIASTGKNRKKKETHATHGAGKGHAKRTLGGKKEDRKDDARRT